MVFLKWARLTYFCLKRAVLTHDVYKPQILFRVTNWHIKVSAGAQPWMEEACLTGSMFLLNGRGCIDKNIRKNISPKLNFEVWKL